MNTSPELTEIYRRGRLHYRSSDGRVFPLVAGAEGEGDDDPGAPPELDSLVTVDDLRIERGRVLAGVRDILETAAGRAEGERDLTDEEISEHDALISRADEIDRRLDEAERHDATISRSAAFVRRSRFTPPMVNVSAAPAHEARSLDELLHASPDHVLAGSISRAGVFMPNGHGIMNAVEPVTVRRGDETIGHAPRLDDLLPEHRRVTRAFQQTVSDMGLFGMLIDKSADTFAKGFEVARSHERFRDRWEHVLRAMDVDTSAEGGTWVPTGIGASVHEKVRAVGKIAPLFARVDTPQNPWKWPIEGADATAYRVAEPTGDTESKPTASTPGTVGATFDAEIIGGRILFSKSLEADSAIAILPYVSNKLAMAFVTAEETAILNGDSDGTHQDLDITGSTSALTLWDGLRKRGLANCSADASDAALTSALLRGLRAQMGKFGLDPASLAYIVSVTSYLRLLADTNLLTVDKMGPNAIILNGQIGAIDGIPVVVSEHVRENLNATGTQDGVTTDRTFAVIVNRGEWVMGQRTPLDVEVNDSIYAETYQRVMLGFMREDFQNIGDASSNDDTAVLYNVDLDA